MWDSPQEPPSASDVLVSAAMAGKTPIVMVRVQQTDRANSQIWRSQVNNNNSLLTRTSTFYSVGPKYQLNNKHVFTPNGNISVKM